MGFIKNLISKFRKQNGGPDLSIPQELLDEEDSRTVMNYNGSLFTSEDAVMWRYELNRDNSVDHDLRAKGLMTMQDIQRYFIVKSFIHQAGKV